MPARAGVTAPTTTARRGKVVQAHPEPGQHRPASASASGSPCCVGATNGWPQPIRAVPQAVIARSGAPSPTELTLGDLSRGAEVY